MKQGDVVEVQRELVEIRKLLRQINASTKAEDDQDFELYEDQAELGFFGTTIPNLEPEVNLFETIDREGEKMADPDKEVEVTLELSDEVLLGLSLEAHKRNITFNDLVCEIIQKSLVDEEKES